MRIDGRPLFCLVLWCVLAGCHSQSAVGPVADSTGGTWHGRVDQSFEPAKGAEDDWDFADQEFPEQLSREQAFAILLRTNTFADTHVGISGRLSPQVRAFRSILGQTDAPAVFKDLLRRGRRAGQLYALCALYLLDRPEFDRAVVPYRTARAYVRTYAGCIVGSGRIADIVECREPNAIRLAADQSLSDWFDAHPDGGLPDIVGGAYPHSFRS